jgi:hypothetical protein
MAGLDDHEPVVLQGRIRETRRALGLHIGRLSVSKGRRDRVVILQSVEDNEEGDVMAALSIPRACVKRITYLYPKGQ